MEIQRKCVALRASHIAHVTSGPSKHVSHSAHLMVSSRQVTQAELLFNKHILLYITTSGECLLVILRDLNILISKVELRIVNLDQVMKKGFAYLGSDKPCTVRGALLGCAFYKEKKIKKGLDIIHTVGCELTESKFKAVLKASRESHFLWISVIYIKYCIKRSFLKMTSDGKLSPDFLWRILKRLDRRKYLSFVNYTLQVQ